MERALVILVGYLTACLFAGLVLSLVGVRNGYNYFAVLLEAFYVVALVGLPGWIVLRALFGALLWQGSARPLPQGVSMVLFTIAGLLNALWLPFFANGMNIAISAEIVLFAAAGMTAGFGAWFGERRVRRVTLGDHGGRP